MNRKTLLIICLLNSGLVLYLCYLVFAPRLRKETPSIQKIDTQTQSATLTEEDFLLQYPKAKSLEQKLTLLAQLSSPQNEAALDLIDQEWQTYRTTKTPDAIAISQRLLPFRLQLGTLTFDQDFMNKELQSSEIGIFRREFIMRLYYDQSRFLLGKDQAQDFSTEVIDQWKAFAEMMKEEPSDLRSFPLVALDHLQLTHPDKLKNTERVTAILLLDLLSSPDRTTSDNQRIIKMIANYPQLINEKTLSSFLSSPNRSIQLEARGLLKKSNPELNLWADFAPQTSQEEIKIWEIQTAPAP